jgi:5-methylcytosine-specific restriction endonuclease McrA
VSERELIDETVRRVIARKIEHRRVRLPDASLTSTKLTPTKMSAEGRCRKCGDAAHERPLTRHHLVPESWFLGQPIALRQIRNAHANIVPLCRPCHDQVDSKHPLVRERARRFLRGTFSQQEIAFIISVIGRSWLEENYPSD